MEMEMEIASVIQGSAEMPSSSFWEHFPSRFTLLYLQTLGGMNQIKVDPNYLPTPPPLDQVGLGSRLV